MRRVAITGIGVISPLGAAEESFTRAAAGRSAVRRLEDSWCARLDAPLGACAEFEGADHFEAPKARMLDRVSQLAVVAARLAVSDAYLDLTDVDHGRAGIFFGTGMGGWRAIDEGYRTLYQEQSDRINPFTVLQAMNHAPAAWIGLELGITGPNLTYSTACSSSAVSIGEAWLRLRNGELDIAVAGGAEAPLAFGALKAWEALHTLASEDPMDASRSCKPFSRNRTGMVLGEGAAVLVLEDWGGAVRRGATIHAELVGYGTTTDTSHITRPSVAGEAAAMQAALRSAGCSPASIDHIHAHGTGTQANDGVETDAIKAVFGARAYHIPVSATKALHGHLLGASAALEFALELLAMRYGVLLPTMHLDIPSPECDLDYVANEARSAASLRTVMSNAFGFGGTNAALIARAAG